MTSAIKNEQVAQEGVSNKRDWAYLIPAMAMPTFATLCYFVWFADSKLAWALYGATKVLMFVFPALLYFAFERRKLEWDADARRRAWSSIPLGLLTGGGVVALALICWNWTPLGDYVRANATKISEHLTGLQLLDPKVYIPLSLFIITVHSLFEEYYWRWFVFGRLSRQIPANWAILIAGFAFAAHHYVVLDRFFTPFGTIFFGTCVGLGGMLWCWMLRRQRTLIGCWISHALVDAVVLGIGWLLLF
ncbi:CPBP family intramembrane metalloprotease [Candidatus Sumerlaeota bacterium]|nr:CPBP family intramembrane metalloprotease [Candidatus Sumerlaeota bacterium]